jgi:hypothetical protein
MVEIIGPLAGRKLLKSQVGRRIAAYSFPPRNLKKSAMLSNASVTTILPVVDMNRARAFYEGKLGFKPEGPDGDVVP